MDSSAASPRDKKRYDVFLSFRGIDTRRGIVSHLHNALVGRVDSTFKDDESIEIGDTISEEIKEAIRNSKFAIVVISEDYVSSTWCLNELQMIMDLHKKKQLVVLPVFYNVVPSDVKHQRGTFSLKRYQPSMFMRFFSSKERIMAAHVRKWRKALTRVGKVSGKDSRVCKDEATMVDDIVEHIARELASMQPLEMSDIVGMDAHMEQIEPLLDMDSTTNEVRMIGLWGMGGIGKTTIAKCLYNKYSPRFGRRFCFMENIRNAGTNGLPGLQTELLSKILGKKQVTITDKEKGCTIIRSKLKELKVLLVLDGVDNIEQLRALANETSWFGPGSRIIITSRDLGLLNFYRLIFVHQVNFLGHEDSIRVFKQVAFEGGRAPSDVYEQLSIRASKLAQGLPSALDAFGTYLRQKTTTEAWERALDILEKFPPQSIMEIVRTSYKGLDERDQAVFLHLACLFNGDNFHRVATLFDHGYERIKDLKKKSLIDISPDGCITMHVLVEQAGREIVLQESKSKLWRQRILWEPEDIISVLQNTTVTTEGVSLHMCDMLRMVSIDGRVLNAINNLKYFKAFTHLDDIESTLNFFTGTDNLPKTLRLLHWDAYPLTTLPSEHFPYLLTELNLRYSNLVRIWDGKRDLGQLKRLDVTGSKNLTEIPDLSKATSLEELIMKGCTRLKQIPESIGLLSRLRKLDLSQCEWLMNLQIYISETAVLPESRHRQRPQIILTLPRAVKPLASLANLSIEGRIHIELRHLKGNAEHLSFISEKQVHDELLMTAKDQSPISSSVHDFESLSIKRFSYSGDNAPFSCISFSRFPCLTELNLINLNIQIIPEDIGQLHSLEKLDLSGNDFIKLPTSMKNLSKLKHARLSNCVNLEALPGLTELQSLNLSGCNNLKSLLEESPHSVQEVIRYSLLELELESCTKVQSFSQQITHFTSLTYLNLSSNDFEAIPQSITELTSLGTLCLNNCKKLKSVEDLPQSLEHLYAHGCDSLENVILPPNHSIKHLDLSHCFSLQQDEQLITQFLNNGYSEEVNSKQRSICLPGARIPRYFENRSSGRYTKISLSPIRSTPTLLGFAACIVVSCEWSFYMRLPAFSYDWSWEEDDEVIRINLRPNLYRESEIEEEETMASDHLVIVHVASSVNTERIEELRVEAHLQFPDEFRFPPADIRACGIRMISQDLTVSR